MRYEVVRPKVPGRIRFTDEDRRRLVHGALGNDTASHWIPRISRPMALATRFDGLIRSGEVADQADLARLAHVTRARVTQIMSLLSLAPDIHEELLLLPGTVKGRDPIREQMVRPIAAVLDRRKQRRMWEEMKRHTR